MDTLKEAFSASRGLFAGLALDDSDFDFTPSPVIRLDLSLIENATAESLRRGLVTKLSMIAADAGLSIDAIDPSVYLEQLILGLHRCSGQRVVVLIDEYDKPLIDHLHDPSVAQANRAQLRYLYGILKGMDAHLRFVFLTGVSKFSRTSLFSQLNNLTDITLWPRYAGICGIAEREFDALFGDHLRAYQEHAPMRDGVDAHPAITEVKRTVFGWYDGYTWDGVTRVFNPFSLLSFFAALRLYPYWYVSGVPKFIIDRMAANPTLFAEVQEAEITELDLDSHDIEHASLPSLLFQTGFLTVKSVDDSQFPPVYRLGFPNTEVSTSFARHFLGAIRNDQLAPNDCVQ